MWDSGSFESRSFEPGSWLFNLGQSLRKLFNVMRVTVLTKVKRSSTRTTVPSITLRDS